MFAASDQLAIGVMNALHASGLRVPEDVAVVGFDGTNEARYAWPPLTTVAQQMGVAAEEAVHLLVHDSRETIFRIYPTVLQVRRSCGCQGDEPAA